MFKSIKDAIRKKKTEKVCFNCISIAEADYTSNPETELKLLHTKTKEKFSIAEAYYMSNPETELKLLHTEKKRNPQCKHLQSEKPLRNRNKKSRQSPIF